MRHSTRLLKIQCKLALLTWRLLEMRTEMLEELYLPNFPEVITVSAIVDTDGKCGGKSSTSTSAGKDDTFASFSNYGSVVDLVCSGMLK